MTTQEKTEMLKRVFETYLNCLTFNSPQVIMAFTENELIPRIKELTSIVIDEKESHG